VSSAEPPFGLVVDAVQLPSDALVSDPITRLVEAIARNDPDAPPRISPLPPADWPSWMTQSS